MSAWSFDGTADTVDVSCFGDTNKVYVLGLRDAKGTLSGQWDDVDDTLFDAAEQNTACKMYLYPSRDAITKCWYGNAFVNATVECSVGGSVTVSGDWIAAGPWTRM